MKATGENMSPCSTPLHMSNPSDVILDPSGWRKTTHHVAAVKIAWIIWRNFGDTAALLSASSRNI